MTLFNILFFAIAALIVAATGIAITRRKLVHAVIYLIFAFFGSAFLFYLFGSPFLAALMVIVYAGAIMILFLFIIMMLRVESSDGCVGRCDAKCYEADHKECDCICGGRNHGQGHAKALANTQQMAEAWIEAWKQKNPDKNETFDVPGKQLGLF